MTADASPLAAAAKALKARHPALLRREPSFHEPAIDRRMDAIEAARVRLRGNRRLAEGQLSLDVRAAKREA